MQKLVCDICDSEGGTFKYGLTIFGAPVATLITLLCLWRAKEDYGRGPGCGSVSGSFLFCLTCCAFFFFAFPVFIASAYFGYYDMVFGIHLPHVDVL